MLRACKNGNQQDVLLSRDVLKTLSMWLQPLKRADGKEVRSLPLSLTRSLSHSLAHSLAHSLTHSLAHFR